MAIGVGDEAPDFELENQFGQKVRLSDFRGTKNVVLIFFPKAFTGICTGELCAIREEKADFISDDVVTFGISCDSSATLKAFSEQQDLGFELLSDWWPHGATGRAYGVFLDDKGFDTRGTFVIDKAGKVRWTVVHAPSDARSNDEYREALAELD